MQWDESQMYLKAGEQISVDQLLAGLIVMSANDAAVTLAEKFLVMCLISYSRITQALGMKDTHFSNPAGITMPDHYTTAHDLSLLSQAVIHQTLNIYIIRKCRASYNQRFHHATNLALKYDPSVDGLKLAIPKQQVITWL